MTCESLGGSCLVFIHNKMLCFPDSPPWGTASVLQHALSNHFIIVGCYDRCLFFLSGYKRVHWAFSHHLCRMGHLSQGRGCLILETHPQDGAWLSVRVCWVTMLWESWPPVQGSDGSGVLMDWCLHSALLPQEQVLQSHSVTETLGFSYSEHGIWTQEENRSIWWGQLDGEIHFFLIYPWSDGWLGFWIYAALGIKPKTCVSQRLSHWSTDRLLISYTWKSKY